MNRAIDMATPTHSVESTSYFAAHVERIGAKSITATDVARARRVSDMVLQLARRGRRFA